MTDEDWDSVIDTHLKGTFLCARAAQKHMVEQKYGKMVFLSSTSALGNRGQANYSAAKAGLIGLTKSLCREVGSRAITVNAVAPGFIATEMTNVLGAEVLATMTATIPLRRIGTAEEVAAAVRFLALPEAAYITGHVLHVDGGLAA